jgi:hypothetical protein
MWSRRIAARPWRSARRQPVLVLGVRGVCIVAKPAVQHVTHLRLETCGFRFRFSSFHSPP